MPHLGDIRCTPHLKRKKGFKDEKQTTQEGRLPKARKEESIATDRSGARSKIGGKEEISRKGGSNTQQRRNDGWILCGWVWQEFLI